MTIRSVLLAVALAVAVVGCGSAATASSVASPTTPPTLTPTPPTSPTPTVAATPAPPTPAPTASAAAACGVVPETGLLPSDRITNVEVLPAPRHDVVRFTFGEGSLDPAGPATGKLEAAVPPFTGGASGLPIDVHGDHAVQVVFTGMSLQNDVGQPVYDGPREFEVNDPSRGRLHVVLFEEFEGQMGWYVGYDGPGCVTLSREGDSIVLAIDS